LDNELQFFYFTSNSAAAQALTVVMFLFVGKYLVTICIADF